MLKNLLIISSLFFISIRPISFSTDLIHFKSINNEMPVGQEHSATFRSKRLWFNITNKKYLRDGCQIFVDCKKNIADREFFTFETKNITNWNHGIYYYVDIPVEYNAIRLSSCTKEGNLIKQTKWKYNLYSSRLNEVYDDSDIIRHRRADVFPPDTIVVGMMLSSFYHYNDSYENGYSAYGDIEKYWLSCYAGKIFGHTFDNTYIYDYTSEDYGDSGASKTRRITLNTKINELKEAYTSNPIKKTNNYNQSKKTNSFFLIICLIIAILSVLCMTKSSRKCKDKNVK